MSPPRGDHTPSPRTLDDGTFRSFAFGGPTSGSAHASRSGSLSGETTLESAAVDSHGSVGSGRKSRLNSLNTAASGLDSGLVDPSQSPKTSWSLSTSAETQQQTSVATNTHHAPYPSLEGRSPSPPPFTHDFSTFRFGSASSSSGDPGAIEFLGTPTAELGPFEYPVRVSGGSTSSTRSSLSAGVGASISARGSLSSGDFGDAPDRRGGSISRSRQRSSPRLLPSSSPTAWMTMPAALDPTLPASEMAGLSLDIDDAMVRAATSMRRTSTTTMVPSVPAAGRRPSVQHSASQPAGVPGVAEVRSADAHGQVDGPHSGWTRGSQSHADVGRSHGGSFSSVDSSSSSSSAHSASSSSHHKHGPISPSLSASSSSSSSAATHASHPRQTVQRIVASIAQADAHLAAHTGRRPSILLFSSQQPKEGPVPPSLLNSSRQATADANLRRGSLPTHHLSAKRLDMLQHQAAALQGGPPPLAPGSSSLASIPASIQPLAAKRSSLSAQGGLPRVHDAGTAYERTSVSAAYLYNRRSSLAFPPSTAMMSSGSSGGGGGVGGISGLNLLRPRRRRSSSLSSSSTTTESGPAAAAAAVVGGGQGARPTLQRSYSNTSSRSSVASTLTARSGGAASHSSSTSTPGPGPVPGPCPEPGFSFGSYSTPAPEAMARHAASESFEAESPLAVPAAAAASWAFRRGSLPPSLTTKSHTERSPRRVVRGGGGLDAASTRTTLPSVAAAAAAAAAAAGPSGAAPVRPTAVARTTSAASTTTTTTDSDDGSLSSTTTESNASTTATDLTHPSSSEK